jgi:hypothetical protein
MFGLQLVVLFWEVLETLGGWALLEEVGHWEHDFEDYTQPLIPSSHSTSCPQQDENPLFTIMLQLP